MVKEKVTESIHFQRLTQREKVLHILHDYPNITKDDILNHCYLVTIVTIVTGNNSNNSNKVTDEERNKFKTIIYREINEYKTIKADKSEQAYKYFLTEKGKALVVEKWEDYKKEYFALIKRKESEEKVGHKIKQLEEFLFFLTYPLFSVFKWLCCLSV